MGLAKLHIKPTLSSTLPEFDVLFNPNTYSIVKSVTWSPQRVASGSATDPSATNRDLDAPPLEYGGGGSRTLTLQLFFDVTEPIDGKAIADVREETNKIVRLTRIERDQNKPPVCEITWGKAAPQNSDFPFTGVVTNLTQNFTMFRETGEPVRANLTVVFTEYIDAEQNKRETDPELTTYLVRRGDTLSAIAARLYRDPTLWRTIAVGNAIDDPHHLQIGARLSIPRLS